MKFFVNEQVCYIYSEPLVLDHGVPLRHLGVGVGACAGYFRVTYDDENWRRLAEALSQRLDIHWLNRAQLLDDAFALARAGPLSYQQLFALTDYLSLENEYPPWAAALGGFAYLDRMLTPHPRYHRFQAKQQRPHEALSARAQAYVLHLLSDVYDGYAFKQRAEHSERLLAAAVTARACAMGHQGCRDTAVHLLEQDLFSGAR
ncbi:Aminopeptidase N [Gryllus bimaculatus]|nr:Aminopeptidase N [Gryllus bimaculatus]